LTSNGIQQKTDFRHTFTSFATCRVAEPAGARVAVPAGTFPLFTGIRVFDRDYRNPRVYTVTSGSIRSAPTMAAYFDFTIAKGTHLTRFLNYNVHGTAGQLRSRHA